jgi:hypothetical protein
MQGEDRKTYVGHSSQTGTFNFTGIKRDASMVVLHAAVDRLDRLALRLGFTP